MKKSFTLAEVLITLTIIGVIAALTIPNLMAKYRAKVYHTKLVQANSILKNGIQNAISDGVDIDAVIASDDYSQMSKYFKLGDCTVPNDNIYKNYDGSLNSSLSSATKLRKAYCLNNGMLVWFGYVHLNFSPANADIYGSKTLLVGIDLNGVGTQPNQYGRDVFFWVLNNKNNQLEPFGSINIQNSDASWYFRYGCPPYVNSFSESGISCTQKALSDENYFYNLNMK